MEILCIILALLLIAASALAAKFFNDWSNAMTKNEQLIASFKAAQAKITQLRIDNAVLRRDAISPDTITEAANTDNVVAASDVVDAPAPAEPTP